ncbi:hypothetical protein [Aliiglaciecola sp. NS0011-25]|uniref:hypothetical protein n=1 Tax=Aliiglaciecola sp. NS0011-25 TaxID=3127654 RepID=UPI00310539CB
MLGTHQFTVFIQSLFANSRPPLNTYSPFLRITKPLIDISKRTNINQYMRHLDTRYNNKDTIQRALRREQSALLDALLAGMGFRPMMLQALVQRGYDITTHGEQDLLVTRKGAKAIVRLARPSELTGSLDNSWQQQAILALHNVRVTHDCDAAIYITPGSVSSQLRWLTKNHDLFVLSSWEILRLLHDTQLWHSPTFSLLDNTGGRA